MSQSDSPGPVFSQLAAEFEREVTRFDLVRGQTGQMAMTVLKTADPELHGRLMETFETAATAGAWLTKIVPVYQERPLVLLHQGKRAHVMHALTVLQGNSCA